MPKPLSALLPKVKAALEGGQRHMMHRTDRPTFGEMRDLFNAALAELEAVRGEEYHRDPLNVLTLFGHKLTYTERVLVIPIPEPKNQEPR